MPREYLVNYGRLGDFGRFCSEDNVPLCTRGDFVVIQTQRGIEMGEVLCESGTSHSHLLSTQHVGTLLRPCTSEDHLQRQKCEQIAQELTQWFTERARSESLDLDLLDVELLLEGKHAILHLLQGSAEQLTQLQNAIHEAFNLSCSFQDLADPTLQIQEDVEAESGCGTCGSGGCESGGCSSSTGKGCGNCSSVSGPEMQQYFSALREKMPQGQRYPLT